MNGSQECAFDPHSLASSGSKLRNVISAIPRTLPLCRHIFGRDYGAAVVRMQKREEGLREVRQGRKLWLRSSPGEPRGALASRRLLAILVHGACAHANQWRAQERALQHLGVATLCFDALGCGASEKPRNWSAYAPGELYADFVAIFDAHKQSFAKVVVLGHSFGTALALKLAAERRGQIAGMVLIGAALPLEKPFRPSVFSLARWLFYLPEWVLQWLQPSLTEGFLKAAFDKASWRTQPSLIQQERTASNANPPHMFKAFYRQIESFASRAEFLGWTMAFEQPVALVFGDADQITPLIPNARELKRHLKGAELTVVSDSSHQVMQEKPEDVDKAISALLNRLT